MLRRYLLVWFIALSAAAFWWPDLWGHLGGDVTDSFDPFVQTAPFLTPLIVLAMFSLGCLLPKDDLVDLRRRWKTVVAGTAVQFGTMPLLAFLMASVFGLSRPLFIGVVMVGCVPGAMASNVLTRNAGGNVGYSVSLTTTATLLSPVVVPLALYLCLGATVEPGAFAEASLRLLTEVVVPVVAGYLLCQRFPRFGRSLQTPAEWGANLAILWIIAVVVAINRDRLASATGLVLTVLLAINTLGYVAGWLAGRTMALPVGMRRALTLEVGMQNAGVGAKLALDLFPDIPSAAVPPALYTFGCMLTGTILAQMFAQGAWRSSERIGEAPVITAREPSVPDPSVEVP